MPALGYAGTTRRYGGQWIRTERSEVLLKHDEVMRQVEELFSGQKRKKLWAKLAKQANIGGDSIATRLLGATNSWGETRNPGGRKKKYTHKTRGKKRRDLIAL